MNLAEILEDVGEWREQAACRDSDPDLFFPTGDEDVAKIAIAKAICASCPVEEDCLVYAIELNQTSGIWGGHTATERRSIRRRWLRELREAS
jgi:WhiB family redox-sensing transcriptional regulator